MRTYYILYSIMICLVISSICLSAAFFIEKIGLIALTLGWSVWNMNRLHIQSVNLKFGKILIKAKGEVHAAQCAATTVLTRYLCFLHLKALDSSTQWWLPVSRLEFSPKAFRSLKSNLHRFLMDKN